MNVFDLAREILNRPEPWYGFGDVGDVLVAYLRGSKTEARAIESLRYLEQNYAQDRGRKGPSR